MSEIKARLLNKASELFDIHKRDLNSRVRFAFIMPARFAMYKALRERAWSYPRIGRLFEKDHSTIIHGVKRAEYLMERDASYAAKVNELINLRLTPAALGPEEIEAMIAKLREDHREEEGKDGLEDLIRD
jgi:hypothetical protein